MKKRISELREGDLVDLEHDPFVTGDHPELEFEYATVLEIEVETSACTCVYFDSIAIGFPPDHMVEVA